MSEEGKTEEELAKEVEDKEIADAEATAKAEADVRAEADAAAEKEAEKEAVAESDDTVDVDAEAKAKAEVKAEADAAEKDKPKTDETARFELIKEEPSKPTEGAEETIEIIHKGQAFHLTKEKLIELAQKGFDYDVKVGPHGKLVQMVDADPGLAKTIDDYWKAKIAGEAPVVEKFEIKPITEYEDEGEWLQDNMKRAFKSFVPTPAPVETTVQPSTGNPVENALKMRDPEYAHLVLPHFGKYAGKLSVDDYQKINSDMGALCQFYDFIKQQVITKKPTETTTIKTPTPGFKVKSGGGEAPLAADTTPIWEQSKENFQKIMDKVKGYNT